MKSALFYWVQAARPKTLFASLSPVILGSGFAWAYGGHAFKPLAAILCLLFAVAAQIAANFANDYFDGVGGFDRENRVGPVRAVASGRISAGAMRAAALGMLALAGICGLGLIGFGGWGLILLGGACLIGALAYSRASYAGLGDVLVVVFFGFAAVCGTFYVQAGAPPWPVWAAALAAGCLCDNILLVNNYRDADQDACAGKRTLVVRLGRRIARVQYALFIFLACVLLPVVLSCHWQNCWPLLPVVLLPCAWILYARLLHKDSEKLNRLLGQTALFFCLWSFLCALGVVLAA